MPRCGRDWKLSLGSADAKLSAEPKASGTMLLSRLLPAYCALSHLRSRGPSLSLCHWLVFLGLQAQFHRRPLTYLCHLKRWSNPSSPHSLPLYSNDVGPGVAKSGGMSNFWHKRQWCQASLFPTSTSTKSQLTREGALPCPYTL